MYGVIGSVVVVVQYYTTMVNTICLGITTRPPLRQERCYFGVTLGSCKQSKAGDPLRHLLVDVRAKVAAMTYECRT